jgi:hypothetical protein
MPLTAASIASQYGITANYWKIGQLYIDYSTNTGFVNYVGYDSEINAFTGKTPIKNLEIRLNAADITGIFGEATYQDTLTVTGASVISYYDTLIASPSKNTALVYGPVDDYPAGGS